MEENSKEKSHGKFESMIYLIVIPVIFTLVLTGVIMNFLGYPVLQTMGKWGIHIPVVKNLLPGGAEKAKENAKDATPAAQASGVAQPKDAKADPANQQPTQEQKQIDDLKKQNEELQKQLDQKKAEQDQAQIEQAASLYATMSGSKAANIIEAMPLDQAAYIMSGLDAEQQSNVLGSFKDPKRAANVTTLIEEIGSGQDKQTVQDMAKQLESPASTLTQTISAMPAAQSALMIQSMMSVNPKDAMDVLKNMNTATRSQVLTEITKLNPKLAAAISSNLTK